MRRFSSVLLLLAGVAGLVNAQTTTLPFGIRVQQEGLTSDVADGATLSLASDGVGRAREARLAVTYRGTNVNTFINSITLNGSTDFTLGDAFLDPVNIAPNASLGVVVRYTPTSSRAVSARVTFAWQEGTRTGTFALNFNGAAPELTYNWIPVNGSAQPLASGDTIAFPATNIDETAVATVIIGNRGTAPGTVNSVTATGANFTLAGVPFPPFAVEPNRDVRFTVRYTPRAIETNTGQLRIETVTGALTNPLQGSGQGAVFAYDVIQDNSVSALLPNGAFAMPDTLVGERSTATVRVRNSGNVDARIAALSVAGTGFTLSEAPFVPLVLAPGAAATLTVNFAPTAPGRATAKLRIGTADFDISANGIGPSLTYSYLAGNNSVAVQNNQTVIVPAANVGQTSQIRFVITNTGSAPTPVNSISVASANDVFVVSGAPSLPASVAAGATVPFTITFAPKVAGTVTGTLRIDTQTFPLSAVAGNPAALPAYRFTGASGAQEPLQQPEVGLSLAERYPLALTGTLTLSFTSDVFANDPAVQFASGGRTLAFTIPANSTDAVFPNGATRIRIQTGTVAGTITLTPAFNTTEGGINLTPTNPPALNLTVGQSAPRLLSLAVQGKTANTVTLLLTGYATARALTQMDFTFAAVSGENVATQRLTIGAEPSFTAWYQSAASQQFGSQFSATVTFTLTGDVKNVTNLTDTIQSISATITNRQGVSQSRSVDLR